VRPAKTSLKDHLSRVREQGPRYLRDRAEHKLRQRLEGLTERLKVRFYTSQNKPFPVELRDARLTQAFVAASHRYVARPYPGKVVLYRATHVAREFQHAGPKQGWEAFAPQLEIVEVPGDHDSLVREPNVGTLASHLSVALRTARRATSV
jgi:thioesterase domain-containing protein